MGPLTTTTALGGAALALQLMPLRGEEGGRDGGSGRRGIKAAPLVRNDCEKVLFESRKPWFVVASL